jgi:hypothetical protein
MRPHDIMKNAVFWDVTPCGSCKNRLFRGMYLLHHQGDKNRGNRNNVSSPILVILMMEAIRSSETSALTKVTRRNILEVGIRHSHRRGNLKSYIA